MRIVKEHDERKNEIIDTAAELFLDKGYDQCSINDILNSIGIAKGTFYHYFKSKEDVLDAAVNKMSEPSPTNTTILCMTTLGFAVPTVACAGACGSRQTKLLYCCIWLGLPCTSWRRFFLGADKPPGWWQVVAAFFGKKVLQFWTTCGIHLQVYTNHA